MVPRAGNWCVWRNGGRSAGWQLRCGVRAFDFDKRVLRLMRADNLLAVRKRRFVFTTDSRHGYAVYANLATRLQLTGINQLWVADITYVRLRETFLYLAILMDAYSRRVVGWELGEDLRAELALSALNRRWLSAPSSPASCTTRTAACSIEVRRTWSDYRHMGSPSA